MGKYFVLGLAKSGRGIAMLLAEKGNTVTVWDDSTSVIDEFARTPHANISVATRGVTGAAVDACDVVVVSPGVPLENEWIMRARRNGKPVVGEVEVAMRFSSARTVCVTGTNGKSTTVGVIGSILSRAGIDCVVAGNVGTPVSEVLRISDHDTMVLELSSFQLDTMDQFRPDVAVLLNVTPDHLDRYDHSFSAYAASKGRILNRAGADTLYVYNAEDEVARELSITHPGESIPFSSRRELSAGLYAKGGKIVRSWKGKTEGIIAREEFTPVGIHNLENALAAIAAVTPYDVQGDDLREALRAYRPLPHRMELVRIRDGVSWINDSKATNVDAAVKSLESIEGRVVLLLGGRDKEGDFSVLLPFGTRVVEAILIGEASEKIEGVVGKAWRTERARDMADAVRIAAGIARKGDTVLLAPACASFDMFANYQERGEVFRDCVRSL